jgi:hypothetical protein
MFKSIYQSMNKQITPSEELLCKTKAKMHDALRQQQAPRKRIIRRPLVLVAVICLCILISIPIMATFIPYFNDLLQIVNPSIGDACSLWSSIPRTTHQDERHRRNE